MKNVFIFLIIFILPFGLFANNNVKYSNNSKSVLKFFVKKHLINYQKIFFNDYSLMNKVVARSHAPSSEASIIQFIIEYSIYVKRMQEIARTGVDPLSDIDYARRRLMESIKAVETMNARGTSMRSEININFIIVLPPLKF
jgi:hypothetical protein